MRPKTDVQTDVRHPMYETGDRLHALREAVAADPATADPSTGSRRAPGGEAHDPDLPRRRYDSLKQIIEIMDRGV